MQLQELAVLDIPDDVYKAHLEGWTGLPQLFHAENCAYHLFIGTQETMRHLPQAVQRLVSRKNNECQLLEGREAYSYVLQILCGLKEEQKIGESRQTDTMKSRWKAHKRDNPQIDSDFKAVVDGLFKDNTLIRGTFLEQRLKAEGQEPCVTARTMAGITRSDCRAGRGAKVALVADSVEHVHTIALALGQHVSELWITHPDPEQTANLQKLVKDIVTKHRIDARVEVIPFEDAVDVAIPVADHVFVDKPVRHGDEVDDAIVKAWKSRGEESPGHLIMLVGDRSQNGRFPSEYGSVQGLISLPMIKQARENIRSANLEQVRLAEQACGNCAMSRKESRNPRADLLHLPPDEYRVQMWIGTSPVPQARGGARQQPFVR